MNCCMDEWQETHPIQGLGTAWRKKEEDPQPHPARLGTAWYLILFVKLIYIRIHFRPCIPLRSVEMPPVCHNEERKRNALFSESTAWTLYVGKSVYMSSNLLVLCWAVESTDRAVRQPRGSGVLGGHSVKFSSLAQNSMRKLSYGMNSLNDWLCPLSFGVLTIKTTLFTQLWA